MDDLKSIYIDCPSWSKPVKPDDFLVAIGKLQSNSVYHVFSVCPKEIPEKRIVRYYLKVYKSDLITCLSRDESQNLFNVTWYSRNKKRK